MNGILPSAGPASLHEGSPGGGPQASACPGCGAQSDRTELSRNLWVCPSAVTIFPWMHTAA